ncbi:MAG: SAM-dependent methyltransferase, partial [Myxococcota bacterium]
AWTPWVNPVPLAGINRLLDAIDLPRGASVADLGCGKGELMIRLAERADSDVHAYGVDQCEPLIIEARAQAKMRASGAGLIFEIGEAGDLAARLPPVDLAAAIGAHPFGQSWSETLEGLSGLVRKGGLVLGGEGFEVSGSQPMLSHVGLIEIARVWGLELVATAMATPEDCAEYEQHCLASVLQWCTDNPDHAEAEALRQRSHIWYDTWQQTRVVAPGFGLYLFRAR